MRSCRFILITYIDTRQCCDKNKFEFELCSLYSVSINVNLMYIYIKCDIIMTMTNDSTFERIELNCGCAINENSGELYKECMSHQKAYFVQ